MSWKETVDGFDTYETARDEFNMELPADYNVAADCIRKHDKVAEDCNPKIITTNDNII